jgi:hypothetical protein
LQVSVYSKNVFNQKEVSVWCNKFKDVQTPLNDDLEKPRVTPRTLHTDENCKIEESKFVNCIAITGYMVLHIPWKGTLL